MACHIAGVDKGSPAYKAGLRPGCMLMSINGQEICDVLDYQFYSTDEKLHILVERSGKEYAFTVKKDPYEPLGLEFDTYLIDKPRRCQNRCIFCFIDQLPKGMRKTLYFKDDDTRLSFLTGNYVTLTNLKENDIEKILKQRISPVNVSVQATNPETRCKLLGNRKAGELLPLMKRLADGHIEMNCQIVLCRGVNDGAELKRSLDDLAEFYPQVPSVSIVPAGLTKYREGLYPLTDFSAEEAAEIIELVTNKAKECLEKYDCRMFYLADEFYLKAGLPIPPAEAYEGFPQIENGVGLLASFEEEFLDELSYLKEEGFEARPERISIATGSAAYPFLVRLVDALRQTCDNCHIKVFEIKNNFFGHGVTVSGLLTGQDLYAQLKDRELGDRLLLSETMFRDHTDVFLDDWTMAELSDKLKVEIQTAPQDGAAFLNKLVKELG